MQEKLVCRVGADIRGFKQGLSQATDFALSSVKKMVAAFTGLITITSMVGSKFEKTLMETATVAQAFGKDLEALSKKATQMGKTTAFSSTQVAAAMYDLASAGMKTKEILYATDATIKLAGATASEASQATHLLAATLRQFAMDASESRRITDTFTAAITNSLLRLDTLTEAMKYAGTTGASLKWSIEETTAAVAMFADLGLEGSMMGTNLRMAMIQLANQTDKNRETLKQLGIQFEEINPSTKTFGEILARLTDTAMDAQDAVSLFGARAGLNMMQLVNLTRLGVINFESYVAMLKKAQEGIGRTEEMYNRMMDTFWGQWRIFQNALKSIAKAIFEGYKEEGKKVFAYLAEQMRKFANLIEEHKKDIKIAFLDMAATGVSAMSYIVSGISWAIKALLGLKGVILVIKGAFNEIRAGALEREIPALQQKLNILESEYKKRMQPPYAGTLVDQFTGKETRILGGPTGTAIPSQRMEAAELTRALWEAKFKLRETEEELEKINKSAIDSNKAFDDLVGTFEKINKVTDSVKEALEDARNEIIKYRMAVEETGGTPFLSFIEQDIASLEDAIAGQDIRDQLKNLQENIRGRMTGGEFGQYDPASLYKAQAEMLQAQQQAMRDFYEERNKLGKDEFEIRIDEINKQKQEWINAKVDEVEVTRWAEKKITEIKREQTSARLSLLADETGKVAATAKNVLDITKGKSKEAWAIYKVFAIAEATISGIKSVIDAFATGTKYGGPKLGYTYAAVAGLFAASQIAALKSAEPPSYDEGGVSRRPGIYYSGVPEAHIPLKGGRIPVRMSGNAGNTVIIRMENPVFQDVPTQRRAMRILAEETVMRLAPVAVHRDYNNDGRSRNLIRSRG